MKPSDLLVFPLSIRVLPLRPHLGSVNLTLSSDRDLLLGLIPHPSTPPRAEKCSGHIYTAVVQLQKEQSNIRGLRPRPWLLTDAVVAVA